MIMIDNKISLLPKLSQNLLEILNNEEYYDVTIEVGTSDSCIKVFRAHMIILHNRSPYLRRILSMGVRSTNSKCVSRKSSYEKPIRKNENEFVTFLKLIEPFFYL